MDTAKVTTLPSAPQPAASDKPTQVSILAELERLALEVSAGTRRLVEMKAILREGTPQEELISVELRVPNLDDMADIGSRAGLYYGASFDSLPSFDRELARARATVEVLATKPYPAWLPLDKSGNIDTGQMLSYARLLAVARNFNSFLVRFQ